MPTKVIMPSLGESVIEGTITKWLKSKGEVVEEYEPLLEVNTDKVDSEIPSPASGVVLDIVVPEGTTIQAGTLLAWIGEQGEGPEETVPAPEESRPISPTQAPESPDGSSELRMTPAASAAPQPGRDRDLGFISPVVARIAGENNIDLYQIQGSGQGGRITKKDVLAYLEQRKQPAPPRVEPPQKIPEHREPASLPPTPPSPAPQAPTPIPGEIMPLNAVRRAIAEHMVYSKHTSPHVTTVMEVDLSRVVAHREAKKAAFSQDGVNLTYTAYFMAATVAGLKAYPIVNSSWSEEGVLIQREINIGMATSLGEAGLIVPVLKNADGLSLLGLARAVNDLANRARARQLKPDEVKGGTFTITNHGVTNSLFATPIINQPQCGILGIGAIQKRVVVINDAIAIRPMAYLTLTFDHRILDGAIADYFLGKVVEYLQNWT
jgi:pyruvate/2-oxoglutarate dehydrogenase complex dihydrolipoamide acyltransferase (E2) component